MKALLSTQSLQVSIGNCRVCNDLNLAVQPGESWGILGVNGVGKTTLLHTLAGLRSPVHGTICYNDIPISTLSKKQQAKFRGILFQNVTDPFPATVLESVLIGRHPYIENWQWESQQDVKLAKQYLEKMELADKENHLINHLSGGERQRVAIATLLTQQVKLLLLDEPTNHLDLKQQMHAMKLFAELVKESNAAAVSIVHDINIAARYCDRILMLFGEGNFIQGTSSELLKPEILEELYGYPINRISHHNQAIFVPA